MSCFPFQGVLNFSQLPITFSSEFFFSYLLSSQKTPFYSLFAHSFNHEWMLNLTKLLFFIYCENNIIFFSMNPFHIFLVFICFNHV